MTIGIRVTHNHAGGGTAPTWDSQNHRRTTQRQYIRYNELLAISVISVVMSPAGVSAWSPWLIPAWYVCISTKFIHISIQDELFNALKIGEVFSRS
jgi:hypothetical protein